MDSEKLTAMIFRAIPFNYICAIEESANKVRREWLKKEFLAYLDDQLSNQFNVKHAQSDLDKNTHGLGKGSNGFKQV